MRFIELFPVDDWDEDSAPEEKTISPPWWGPPEDELGVAVPQSVVIGRSDHGVIALSHVLVYSVGVAFEFIAVARELKRADTQRLFHEQHAFSLDELPDGFIRLGLELSDGKRVSNIAARAGRHRMMRGDGEPEAPVFMPHGGGGGSGHENAVTMKPGYWLWPLPPAGPLNISCEWPAVGIGLSTVKIDGEKLVTAGGQARKLWE